MMKTIINLFALAAVLALAGCATVSNEQVQTEVAKLGYGTDLASGWQDKIKAFMELRLKDPASAQYLFGEPEKSWLTKPPVQGGGLDVAGYIVDVQINAKNSYGGYTGYKAYEFLLRDNEVVRYASDGWWH